MSTTRVNSTNDRMLSENVVAILARTMKNVSFYDVNHPIVGDTLKEIVVELHSLFEEQVEFTIKLTSGYVIVQDSPLFNRNASIGNLIGACHRRGANAITFYPGVTTEELSHLIEVLTADPAELKNVGGPTGALQAHGVRHITINMPTSSVAGEGQLQALPDWIWIYTTALDVIRNASAEARKSRSLDIAGVHASASDIVDAVNNDGTIVHSLNWMKDMDEYTFVHALHICILGIELGRKLGLSRAQLEELGAATLLHDVGKVFVPLNILRKPDKLTNEEFNIMSYHPVDGAVVLAREAELPDVASVVAYEHHIHNDHSGYPQLRTPRALHLYSLITSIVDIYDALTTMRPYRPPLPPHTAIQLMTNQLAARLEPRLLARFLELLGPHPWGTLLRLSDGLLVVVTKPNQDEPDNPYIRVLDLESKRILEEELSLRALEAGEVEAIDPVPLGINLTNLMHQSLSMENAPEGGASETPIS